MLIILNALGGSMLALEIAAGSKTKACRTHYPFPKVRDPKGKEERAEQATVSTIQKTTRNRKEIVCKWETRIFQTVGGLHARIFKEIQINASRSGAAMAQVG
jgi:hypothetical protein